MAEGYFLPECNWSVYKRNGIWTLSDRTPHDCEATTDEQKAAVTEVGLKLVLQRLKHG